MIPLCGLFSLTTRKTKNKTMEEQIDKQTFTHLDISTRTKQIATIMQQIYFIREDHTSQNIYQFLNMKQPIILSTLKLGML